LAAGFFFSGFWNYLEMAKPSILITQRLPNPVMESLERDFDLNGPSGTGSLQKAALIQGLKRADGLISMLSDGLDREVLAFAPRLKIVANYAVGYNNIDLDAAHQRGIVVTNTPGVLTETTADLCWALLMAVARRVPEGNALIHSGEWQGWRPTELLGYDIYGKTLGLIGMGRIGQAVARRALGFSMPILYHQRHRLPVEAEASLKASYMPLKALLQSADFVSLHLPLNEDSYHLISAEALCLMKKTAFLINTARGPVIDEAALEAALRSGEIAGAGLDVYEHEPAVRSGLLEMPQVVALPHIGSASYETRVNMGRMVLKNLRCFFEGKPVPNMVNSP